MIARLIHRSESAFRFYLEDTLNRFQHHLEHNEFPDDDEREEEHLEIYEMLTDEQRQEVWGLSADLYSLLDNERAPAGNRTLSPGEAAERLHAAYEASDWKELLRLLRLQNEAIQRPEVDYMRYRAWNELGHPEVALAFIQNAVRLDADNSSYKHFLLELLKQMKRWDDLKARAEEYLVSHQGDAGVLLAVGEIYHDLAISLQDPLFDEKAVECICKGLAATDGTALLDSQLNSSAVTLAFALLHLGRQEDAVDLLESWIQKHPDGYNSNAEIYAARGIVRLTIDYEDAIKDFATAVRLDTKSVFPYWEYSNWLLHEDKWDQGIKIAKAGLQYARRPTDRAKLFHLLAIGFAFQDKDELSLSLSLMNEARRNDPTDELLVANLQILNSATHPPESCHDALQLPARGTRDAKTLLRQVAAQQRQLGCDGLGLRVSRKS